MSERYEPNSFEDKWRSRWSEAQLFRTREVPGKPKFYGLDFFPYPSGAGLSVGHCRNYIPTDVICRKKLMEGFNVLHPMGFDAFGLPAENEAISKKTHPSPMVKSYGENYRRQMDLVGISYDWSRSFYSSDPEYYKWTQWIFELLYKRGLAYRRLAKVNWCPKDLTVLADEEVEGGNCWRCGTPVEKKDIPQWFFKITAYAQRLIDDLDTVDWPDGIKNMQRNWIGRSEGVEFDMKVVFDSPSLFGGTTKREGLGREFPGELDSTPLPPPFSRNEKEEGDSESDFVVISHEPGPHFRVFTTRIDTIFGMTFCVIAPEHPLVETILSTVPAERKTEVEAYCTAAKAVSDLDRQATTREKSGVFAGAFAVNPANGKHVPIYVADYVLMGYGTGAIMSVPGHDQRDFDFAKKFGIEIIPVIKDVGMDGAGSETSTISPNSPSSSTSIDHASEAKDGILINSGEYDGLSVAEAQKLLGEWMEGLEIGEQIVRYKLRDWLISRQRYWGCPIPVVHSKDGDESLVPEEDLPVELPDVESYEPADDGSSPLSRIREFVNVTDPEGTLGQRETDTMGGFACSSWYFLRFCDPTNSEDPWDPAKADYWMPVDCYVGGAEHAVMHLLYARFWTKVLFDEGLVSVSEPFQRLMNQGQVLGLTPYRKPQEGEKLQVGEEGLLTSFDEAAEIQAKIDSGELDADNLFYRWARMSKSKGNVVTPDEMVDQYGADALRIYELFVAPFESDVQWSNDGVAGATRFLNRVFRWVSDVQDYYEPNWESFLAVENVEGKGIGIRRAIHQATKKISADIDRFAFNTYVSEMMKCLNVVTDALKNADWTDRGFILAMSEAVETLVLLLAPAAPFSADELWESIGRNGFTLNQHWPSYSEAIAAEDTVTIAVQVNGKLRDTITLGADATNEEMEAAAMSSEKVKVHTDGKQIRKVIVIPAKLVNIVAQ